MLKRLIPGLVVFCLVAGPVVVRAAAEPNPAVTPHIVVRVQSIDGLLAHVKHIAKLADMEEQATQFEKTWKSRLGDKGFDGIDTKRPLGAYVVINEEPQKSTAVILVPITDPATFLDLLERVNLKAEKGKDDIYAIKLPDPPITVHLRFANKYAYLAPEIPNEGVPEGLAKDKLLDPAPLLALDPTAVASAAVRIDKIPDNLKQLAIQRIELELAKERDKKEPGATEAQQKAKAALFDAFMAEIVGLIKDGGETALKVNIDAKSNDLIVELALSGKADSKLAKRIASQAQEKNKFGGFAGRESALSVLGRGIYPEGISKAFGQLLGEQMRQNLENEKDAPKRDLLAKLFKTIEPELSSIGNSEFGIDLRGPSAGKLYTLVGAQSVKDGKALEKGLQDVVKGLPPELQNLINMDAEKAGAISIHRLDVHKTGSAEYGQAFGDNPAYVAFRADAMVIAMGEKGLEALKEALTAQPQAGPMLRVDASVIRLASMNKDFKGFPKAALDALAKDKDGDKILLTLEGGKALTLRLDAKLTLVRLIAELAKAQGMGE